MESARPAPKLVVLPSDHFRCAHYSCVLSYQRCVERQLRTTIHVTRSRVDQHKVETVTPQDPFCAELCEQGRLHRAMFPVVQTSAPGRTGPFGPERAYSEAPMHGEGAGAGAEKLVCNVPDCGNKIRRDNQTGLCSSCRNSAVNVRQYGKSTAEGAIRQAVASSAASGLPNVRSMPDEFIQACIDEGVRRYTEWQKKITGAAAVGLRRAPTPEAT